MTANLAFAKSVMKQIYFVHFFTKHMRGLAIALVLKRNRKAVAAIRHKYLNKPTVIDNIRFSSRKEAAFFKSLQERKASGEVIFFLRQVPFHLQSGTRYVVDFVLFLQSGDVEFIDVKGGSFRTDVYKLKKKMVESEFPITIKEV